MKTVGIIAEFNPFHNGHKYLIEQVKKETSADYVVVVMSGSFTQRGIPSCMDKFTRCTHALSCGADLVLELPVSYATASAEAFAFGGVSVLDSLSVIDYIGFGSEIGDISKLCDVTEKITNPSPQFSEDLNKALSSGLSYPAARAAALPEYDYILNDPNNILGIEYIKALNLLESSISPITIQRIGKNYHDDNISTDNFSSADAIRKHWDANNEQLKDSVPDCVYDSINKLGGISAPIYLDDFTSCLFYKLLISDIDELSSYQDMNEFIARRIKKNMQSAASFSELIMSLKTKELTYSRLNRALLHCMLNLKDFTRDYSNKLIPCPYTRILGFRKDSRELMHRIAASSQISLVNKAADAPSLLSTDALSLFEQTLCSDRIYDQIVMQKYGTRPKDGCLISPIIL